MSDSGPTPRERWRRADEILDLALDAPPSERAALVADACGSDAELRREVESLLKADEQAGRFLEPPLPAVDTEGSLLNATAPLARDRVLAARYRIDEPIGRGGMGLVYRARDLVLQTDVAVKVLDPDVVARPGRLEAFRREVRLARLVTHPNVCRVHDIVEDGALTFITMEHVVGESLAQRLERASPPSREWCRRVLADVLRGLAAAHAAKVIHRDLKPGNVMLRDGTDDAVVADFGVAAEAVGADSRSTARGGTRGYMAPEQASGAAPDVRSDIFSFGVLAHRVATGALPGETPARAVPAELAALVSACLRTDPGERPSSADAVLAMLGEAGVKRGRTLAAVAIVAVLGALLGIAAWSRAHRPASQPPAELLVAAVDTSQLDAREAWLGDALQHLIVNDLVDAWSLEARASPNASVPPGATVRSHLWRDASGGLRASVTMPGDRQAQPAQGGSLAAVAEEASRRIVERTVPAAARHPTAQELREVGASDAEAWRQLRRARRASRMEQWPRVRALAGDAVARDPGFCMAWLELALTQNAEDGARRPLLDKVVALGDPAQGLSPLSRLGVEFARSSLAGDGPGMARVLEGLAALKLEGQDLLYVRTRLALAPFAQGDPETGLPLLERISEEWPQDAAAPKRLAIYHLGRIERSSPPLAVRYGRMAVSLAPEDVAARATLARALVLAGDEAGAREQAAVLAMADPDQKQGAFLFALHMTLGEVEEATADARRLLLDPAMRAQGQAALATIALARGDFEGGLAQLDAAAAEYERLHGDALVVLTRWQEAWQSYALGRPVRTAGAPAGSLSGKYARCIAIVDTLARMRSGAAPAGPAAIASLRREIDRLPADSEWMLERATFELLIRYTRKDWAGVVAAHHDLESRLVPLGTAYYAADALERLGRRDEAVRVYELLATHPDAWRQPYRRGQAWLRLGILRQQAGDADGARRAFESLLRLWDRAPRDMPEIREAERRLAGSRAATRVNLGWRPGA